MSEGSTEFDGSVIEYVQHPDYYAGIYNAVLVVAAVNIETGDEVMLFTEPGKVEVEYDEKFRSYVLSGCQTENGREVDLRVEHHHKREEEVTHVVATTDELHESRLVGARWGIEDLEGVNFA
jgi:hypothetical protein